MGFLTCIIPGCGQKHYGRGWCRGHYDYWRKTGEVGSGPLPPKPLPPAVINCTVQGCARENHARGLCNAHYEQLRRREPGIANHPPPTWLVHVRISQFARRVFWLLAQRRNLPVEVAVAEAVERQALLYHPKRKGPRRKDKAWPLPPDPAEEDK